MIAEQPRTRSSRRTLTVVVGALVLVVLLTAGAVLLGSLVRSPGEAAARSRPPDLTPIVAPVEHRVLRDTVTVYGVVSAARTFDVALRGFDVPRADPLVTAIPLRGGDRVRFGRSVIEVAGRPLIAVPGPVPLYRDLVPGDVGADVEQVQAGLRAAGLRVTDPRGRYGPSTAAAVRALYRGLGYPPRPDVEAEPGQATETSRSRETGRAVMPLRGPMVPRSEFVAVPRAQMRVGQVLGGIGDVADGPLLRLTGGAGVLRATLGPGEAALVRVGTRAAATVDGRSVEGRVTAVRDQAASADGATPAGTVAVVSLDRPLTVAHLGDELPVRIVVSSSAGRVLVVPASAVQAATDGSAAVVLAPDGRRLRVRLGLTAGGYVAVTPVDGTLRAGDEVLVGVP